MTLFVASLLVAVLTVAYAKYQSALYTREYSSRVATPAQFGVSPDTIKSWFDQGLDVAANLPSIALTTVSILELSEFDEPLLEAMTIIAALAATAFVVVFGRPKHAGGVQPFGISILSLVLIVVNLLGVIVAL